MNEIPILNVGRKYEYPFAYPPPFLKAYLRLKDGRKVLINIDSFEDQNPDFYNFYSEQHGNYIVYEFTEGHTGAVVLINLDKKTEQLLHGYGQLTIVKFLKEGVIIFEQLDTYKLTLFNYITGDMYSATEFEERDFRLIDDTSAFDLDLKLGQNPDDKNIIWDIREHELIITYELLGIQVTYNFKRKNETIEDISPLIMLWSRKRLSGYSFREIFTFSHYWMGQLLDINGVSRYTETMENKNANMLNVIILLHNVGIIQEEDAKYVRYPRFIELYLKSLYELIQMSHPERVPYEHIPPAEMSETMKLHYEKIRYIKRTIDNEYR